MECDIVRQTSTLRWARIVHRTKVKRGWIDRLFCMPSEIVTTTAHLEQAWVNGHGAITWRPIETVTIEKDGG